MPSDVMEPQGNPAGAPSSNQGLTAPLRDKLACLALLSEKIAAIADGCSTACGSLAEPATRRSELGSAVAMLRSKVAKLGALQDELARGVMRYSILLEDAATEEAFGSAQPDRAHTSHLASKGLWEVLSCSKRIVTSSSSSGRT